MSTETAAQAAYIVAALLFIAALAGLSKHETAKVADRYRRRIHRTLAELTPGQRAADRRRQALAAGDWQPPAARHRIALGPDHVIAQRRRLVIDRAGCSSSGRSAAMARRE